MPALTAHDHELLAMPAIASQFPVQFANGAVWETLTGDCKGCSCKIEPAKLRGCVNRPYPHVAVVEAVGVCRDCKLLTRFLYRLHDDMRISGPRDGKWLEWRAKSSLLDRLRKFVDL